MYPKQHLGFLERKQHRKRTRKFPSRLAPFTARDKLTGQRAAPEEAVGNAGAQTASWQRAEVENGALSVVPTKITGCSAYSEEE